MSTLDLIAVGVLTLAPWLGFLAAAELANMRDRRRRRATRARMRRMRLDGQPPRLTAWHEDPILHDRPGRGTRR